MKREAPPLLAASRVSFTRKGDGAFLGHWLILPAEVHLRYQRPREQPIEVEVRSGDEPVHVVADAGAIRVLPSKAASPPLCVGHRG